MIHHNLDLFYDIYNTANEHNQRQTLYLSLIPIILMSIFNWIKNLYNFITSSASSFIMIFMLSHLECITRCSILSMEEIKLFAIFNWIFHVLDFLRSFMISFKYGLILLRHSIDSVFVSHLLLYSI